DLKVPTGYIPLCTRRGCEMKESFYVRPETFLPDDQKGPTRSLIGLLTNVVEVLAWRLSEAGFEDAVRVPGKGCLRVMRYPPLSEAPESNLMDALARSGAERAAPHVDLNALTLLPFATTPGLELLAPDGCWYDAGNATTRLVVHVGQEL